MVLEGRGAERRSLFARSLAALTACAHILGIGDRHLDNFLLSLSTGRVVSIDFGHAFGSATYLLPVPELMGVRLTRQLTSFLKPLDTNVLLKVHMVVTFEALRRKRSELMRLMEVFLSEPIVDWESHTRKLSAEQRKKVEGDAEELPPTQIDVPPGQTASVSPPARRGKSSSVPKGATAREVAATAGSAAATAGGASARLSKGWATLRLSSVEAKLRGGNSAMLTMRDLENATNPDVKKSMGALRDIVMGPDDSLRRRMPESGLSAAEQVDVLVEQATDENILGRTWRGWAPWL